MSGDQNITYEPSEPELTPSNSQEGNVKLITAYTMTHSELALTPQERGLGVIADSAFICLAYAQYKQKMGVKS